MIRNLKYLKKFNESFNEVNDRPLIDKTEKELHRLTTDEVGEDRKEAIRELGIRYQEKLGNRETIEDLDYKEPKVSKIIT